MKSREEIIEQLLKIHTLAERGVGGEKTSAQEMLAKLMKKYEVTEEELFQDKVDCIFYKYKNHIEEGILIQTIFSVLGYVDFYGHRKKRKVIGVYCTKHQQIEIEMKYDFYCVKFYEELSIFQQAFYIKNELYSKDRRNTSEEPTDYDEDELLKIAEMIGILDKHTMAKTIESRKRD